jgi:trehalose-6-phosphatase
VEKLSKCVAVDFDGTLVVSKYPNIVRPKMRMIRKIKRMKRRGWKVILNTCRTGRTLRVATAYCAIHGLIFDAVIENLPERIKAWGGDCRKISADLYLDDKARRVF